MKIEVALLSLLLIQPFSLNASEGDGNKHLIDRGGNYLYQYLHSELEDVSKTIKIEPNRVYTLDDNHTIELDENERGNFVLREYLDQKLWTEIEQDGNNIIISSYHLGTKDTVETYNHKKLIKEQLYDREGVIKVSYEYTDYSVIERDYTDGIITGLTETGETGVIRTGEYLDGKLIKQTLFTDSGAVAAIQNFDQDELISDQETYNEDGVVTGRSEYQHGIITKDYVYYDDGITPKVVSSYENGVKLHANQFTPEGVLTNKLTYYTSGPEIGMVKYNKRFDSSGIMREQLRYDSKGQIDQRRLYSESGVIENYYNYTDTKLTSEYLFDEQGVPTDYQSYYPDKSIHNHVYYTNGIRTKREVLGDTGVLEKLSVYKPDGSGYAKTTTYYTTGRNIGATKAIYTYYQDLDIIEKEQQYSQDGILTSTRLNDKNGKIKVESEFDDEQLTKKTLYSPQGKVQKIEYYENGKLARTAIYNENSSYKLNYYLGTKLVRTDYFNNNNIRYKVESHIKTKKIEGFKTKKVGVCDMTTTREKNVVVDVGVDTDYANRDYYAYTNKYGQLIRVDAAQIIAQNETYEDMVWGLSGVGKEERYCVSEAQVTGSEPAKYDRGHVIADSLGGAANAYNITPEVEAINVSGGQAKMEQMFRDAFTNKQVVTDFTMKISYKNKSTNIPDEYTVSFKINGEEYNYSQKNR